MPVRSWVYSQFVKRCLVLALCWLKPSIALSLASRSLQCSERRSRADRQAGAADFHLNRSLKMPWPPIIGRQGRTGSESRLATLHLHVPRVLPRCAPFRHFRLWTVRLTFKLGHKARSQTSTVNRHLILNVRSTSATHNGHRCSDRCRTTAPGAHTRRRRAGEFRILPTLSGFMAPEPRVRFSHRVPQTKDRRTTRLRSFEQQTIASSYSLFQTPHTRGFAAGHTE